MRKRALDLIIFVIALLGLCIGVVALLSPLPIGVIIIAISLSALVCVSPRSRVLLQRMRANSRAINTKLHQLEDKLERRFKFLWRAFVQTRPHQPEQKDDL